MTPWRMMEGVPPLAGARVTLLGLGLFGGGVGAVRFLVSRGARVLVTDQRPESELRESIAGLAGLPVEYRLGGHREEDVASADFVLVNPAIPPTHPLLARARALESEMNLFFKLCPARPVVGITGSNGKTTTTALVGKILERAPGRTWVGGNIGVSLLERLDGIGPSDLVVLELSSFQLEHLDAIRRSPNVSVVMNLTPNHLDRHGTMEAYGEAKRAIVRHQAPADWRVLNADDPIVSRFDGPGAAARFSLKGDADVVAAGEQLRWRLLGRKGVLDVAGRKLPGWFNLQNMAAAAAASRLALPDWDGWEAAAADIFRTFPGVEHRLEFVGESGGVKYYNDSIATNPESTLAALDTLEGPIVLIAGGFDKKLPFDALGRRIAERVRTAVLTGDTAGAIAEAIGPGRTEVLRAEAFDAAVALARGAARPGDTVLLSPACASFGQFRNFAERGRRFKELLGS